MQSAYPFKAPHLLAALGHIKHQGAGFTSLPALRQMALRKHVILALLMFFLVMFYGPASYRHALKPDFDTLHTEHNQTTHEQEITTPIGHEQKQQEEASKEIPNIVHLVQLQAHQDAKIHFSFQSFLCLYSAVQFIKPRTIFIHTDFDQSALDYAVENGSSWTRKVLTMFPDTVRLNPVTPPTSAANGLPLQRIEHKSDFVRMEQMALYGGIYLDWDVLTLRSPVPLLKSGFAAVVGRQADDNINNGCFMARRDSALVKLMNQEMPLVFSGEWQQHSTGLITPIAERIAYTPGEVLIMDHKAFAPTNWNGDSAGPLFSEREEGEAPVPLSQQANVDTVDPLERWNNRTRGAEWEMDFSQTYFLHAFKPLWGPVPRFEGITVPYILRRKSNFALAAWPLVMQGIKEGIIDENDGIL